MKIKKIILKEKLLIVFLNLISALLLSVNISEAKMTPISHRGKLILENEPKIGEIATIKQIIIVDYDDPDAELGCFFPESLEFINDKGYKISFVQPPLSLEKGIRVIFYSGPIKKGEVKEAIFKVRIPDGKRYIIRGGGPHDPEGKLELDLGNPEPPEWDSQSDIKQLVANKPTELTIPQDSFPPLRTELKIRTKERPSFNYSEYIYNPQPGKEAIIPVRYLIYTEEEAPQVKVTLKLPQRLEFIKEGDYKISSLEDGGQKVLLYSGPMRFKECKAFYFKVEVLAKEEEFTIEAIAQLTTLDGKTLLKDDKLVVNLRRKKL